LSLLSCTFTPDIGAVDWLICADAHPALPAKPQPCPFQGGRIFQMPDYLFIWSFDAVGGGVICDHALNRTVLCLKHQNAFVPSPILSLWNLILQILSFHGFGKAYR
jgi:hypothetical protein